MRRQTRQSGDRTPTLTETMRTAIESYLLEMNTCMPGKFVSYNSSKQTATIQPLFQRLFADGSLVDLPQVTNVPVQHPRTANSFIHLPIKADDPCLLIFSQRSLDTWKQSGEIVDPDDDRIFDLSDAIAIPGLTHSGGEFAPENGDDVIIKNGDSSINVQEAGTFKIQGKDGNELIDLCVQLIGLIEAATTNTLLGPQPFVNLADFTLLKAEFEKIKGG